MERASNYQQEEIKASLKGSPIIVFCQKSAHEKRKFVIWMTKANDRPKMACYF